MSSNNNTRNHQEVLGKRCLDERDGVAKRAKVEVAEDAPPPSTSSSTSSTNGSLMDVDVTPFVCRELARWGDEHFFSVLRQKIHHFIQLCSTIYGDFQGRMCTPDNLRLVARYYAGETLSKQAHTEVRALLRSTKRISIDVIYLAALLNEAQHKVEEMADTCKYKDAMMWENRYDAIDAVISQWNEASEAAKLGDWDELESELWDLDDFEDTEVPGLPGIGYRSVLSNRNYYMV